MISQFDFKPLTATSEVFIYTLVWNKHWEHRNNTILVAYYVLLSWKTNMKLCTKTKKNSFKLSYTRRHNCASSPGLVNSINVMLKQRVASHSRRWRVISSGWWLVGGRWRCIAGTRWRSRICTRRGSRICARRRSRICTSSRWWRGSRISSSRWSLWITSILTWVMSHI